MRVFIIPRQRELGWHIASRKIEFLIIFSIFTTRRTSRNVKRVPPLSRRQTTAVSLGLYIFIGRSIGRRRRCQSSWRQFRCSRFTECRSVTESTGATYDVVRQCKKKCQRQSLRRRHVRSSRFDFWCCAIDCAIVSAASLLPFQADESFQFISCLYCSPREFIFTASRYFHLTSKNFSFFQRSALISYNTVRSSYFIHHHQ